MSNFREKIHEIVVQVENGGGNADWGVGEIIKLHDYEMRELANDIVLSIDEVVRNSGVGQTR